MRAELTGSGTISRIGRYSSGMTVLLAPLAVLGAVEPIRDVVAASAVLRAVHFVVVGFLGICLFCSYGAAVATVRQLSAEDQRALWQRRLSRLTVIGALWFWRTGR